MMGQAFLPHWRRSDTALVLLLVGLCLSTRWLKLNVEPSVPLGLYRLVALPPVLERGMLVHFPAPASVQAWHDVSIPLTKPIAALPGDEVCVLSVGLWIRGEAYGVVHAEAHGLRLPRLRGCFVVQAGEVFTASRNAQSLDSRYYGAVPVADLTAQALPLLTWRSR